VNPAIAKLYDAWYEKTGDANAAATLTAADLQTQQCKGKPRSDWLTIKQAASEFNISERSLYRLTDIHRRRGRSVRIKRQELESYLDGTPDLLD
jgi:excisionase family DNA binding protein